MHSYIPNNVQTISFDHFTPEFLLVRDESESFQKYLLLFVNLTVPIVMQRTIKRKTSLQD
jgi:hypothetical protein